MTNNTGLSTTAYASAIAESVLNGQKAQAAEQFERALFEGFRAGSLLAEIAEIIGEGRALIYIAAAFIEKTTNHKGN